MDLIRELLLKLEAWHMELGDVFSIGPDDPGIAVAGYSDAEIEYHLTLLREKGFINCPGSQPMLGITYAGLTWEGHDFLDAVRSPEIWNKTQDSARAAGGFTVDLLKDLAKGLVKKQIEEYTGVKI
ncbi:MAG: DUF2513 domain-containing protein [Herbaspirillum sp.]|nr:DUF2513 domain-containing protein [Herbaspirillum sp.]MCP3947518.1 DUF2513 domain-containing protein [Herbaspirillum sp.]MCP3947529.1 DUF2513 domain-containing protein [Herbaspirillum sp.]MCP4033102.1 DUF2513 domain-containing protein [Herbaspirillum sp.]MCP4556813.1 DUF2513 domain-containing protein [Herbaspirillum sp.]